MLMVNQLVGFGANPGTPGWIFTGGTPSAKSTFSGSSAANAFDNNTGTDWFATTNANEWVQYQLPTARVGNLLRLRNAYNAGEPAYRCNAFTLNGSNDGSTWSGNLVSNNLAANASDQDFSFTDAEYLYWRLNITNSYGATFCGITEFQVYGLL